MQFSIGVTGRKAVRNDELTYICGNSIDTVNFTFDTEWSSYTGKVARFVYEKKGAIMFQDVAFSSTTVKIPAITDIRELRVGVYSGDKITSTPAVIQCDKSIKCDTDTVDAPAPDVYAEIMNLFNQTYIDPSITVVDTTYNPDSYNPQSGKAVAEAVNEAKSEIDELETSTKMKIEQATTAKFYLEDFTVGSIDPTTGEILSTPKTHLISKKLSDRYTYARGYRVKTTGDVVCDIVVYMPDGTIQMVENATGGDGKEHEFLTEYPSRFMFTINGATDIDNDTSRQYIYDKASMTTTVAVMLNNINTTSEDGEGDYEGSKISDTINPMTIDGAVVENFYNPEIADVVTEKYIDQNGKAQNNNGYQYFKVKLYSGKKYRTNITNIYSLIVFENNEFDGSKGVVAHYEAVGTAQAFEIPEIGIDEKPLDKIVTVYITCQPKYFLGDKNIVVEGENSPVGTEKYKISFPWLTIDEEAEGFVEPIAIDGAVVENFYIPEIADPVTGKYINYTNGKIESSTSYMYCKVKLLSGKKYCSNLGYSVAVFDNGKDDGTGNLIFIQNLSRSKVFTVPELKEKVIIAYFSFSISDYNKVDGKFIVVEGETAPKGNETYKIAFPWLSVGENETEDDGNEEDTSQIFSAYSVDEVKLKQKMPPYLFDGFECENYFDADYMIANATEDSQKMYYHTPYLYLPEGTYSITNCYSYKFMSKDGTIGTPTLVGNKATTFTITEENPYVSFLILCKIGGVGNPEALRDISVQKGDTATKGVPYKYKLSDKFDITDIVRKIANEVTTPHPTHWQGKNYVAIGDSITYGYAPEGNSEGLAKGVRQSVYYSKVVKENLNMELLNVAQSGANVKSALGLQEKFNNQVQQAIEFNADIVTIMLGVNDSGASTTEQHVPLGTIDDVYDESNVTFYAGLSEIISRIQTALPNATIILLSSPKNKFTVYQTKQDYFKAVKDVAEKYDVLFCDVYNAGCGFNINNPECVSEFILNDVHPDAKAHKIIGSRLTGFIASH